mgnify:CR=1 FL=1
MSEKKNTGKKAVIAVIVIALIVAIIALVAVISGKSKKDGSKSATEGRHRRTMRSGQFDIDYAKQVTKLADYSGVAITVSNDYEIKRYSKSRHI